MRTALPAAISGTLLLSGCAFLSGCAVAAPRAGAPGEKPRWTSENGAASVELGGLVQVLGRADGPERTVGADFELKRVRPELSGNFVGLEFNLEPNFSEDDVELEEAWIGPRLFGGQALLHLGRMKAPFNLEEVRSRRHIDFPFFSIVNQFAPAEDHGVFLLGGSADQRWEYGAAVYNGTGSSDTNSSKDVALRLMAHPWAEQGESALANLQLGLAGTAGVQDEGLDGETIDNEAHLPVVRFAPDARLDGARDRLGFELAWFRGPWFVQGEYLGLRQEMETTAASEEVGIRGGYLTLGRVLTGESKSFGGVVPAEPYDFATGTGRGAWVVALRCSRLDLDDDLAADLVVPGTFTDRIDTLSAALNWVPNRHAILRTAVVASLYSDEVVIDLESGDREYSFLVEAQLHF